MQKLVIATRSSPLAMWQAKEVARQLETAGFSIELVSLETLGDKKLDVSLSKIGDKGVFTQELEQLLLNGTAHLAVHSAKDMPSRLPEGLEILAFTEREVPNDVLVSHSPGVLLENKEMVIGTSSTRRVAMLTRYFPKVKTVPVRGNLQTRIRKMEEGQCDALLLAYAGVFRMGFKDLIQQVLDTSVFTPAVGQGSLAIETSTSLPPELKSRIKAALNHLETSQVLEAERAFLRTMEGGCSVPVFGFARIENKVLHIQGGIISLDGSEEIREEVSIGLEGQDTENLRKAGSDLANFLLKRGGDKILEKIKQNLHPEKP